MSRSSTSSSDAARALRFAARVLVFCAPLLLGASLFESVLYRTGDSWSIRKAIEAQSRLAGESLLGRANFSQQYNLSKSEMLKRRRPRIVALGSSRVMEFRGFMFSPHEGEFYNAGGMIQTVNDLAAYARQVREGVLPRPEVIIIGIDPWWLSEATDPPEKKSWLDGEEDAVYQFTSHVEAARFLLRHGKSSLPWAIVFGRKPAVSPYYEYPGFGTTALAAGFGERHSDGSFLYTPQLVDFIRQPSYRDRLQQPVLDQIKRNYFLFAPTSKVERVRAAMLLDALTSLREVGIEVYPYEPPFSTEVAEALEHSRTLAVWWGEYRGWLREQIEASGVHCLVVNSPKDYGLDDAYMLDGLHAGEVLDSYIVEDLVKQAPKGSLLASVDLAHLAGLRKSEGVIPLSFEPPPGVSKIPQVQR